MTGASVRWKRWADVKKSDYLVLSTGVEIVVTLVAPDPEMNLVRVSGRIVTAPTPTGSPMYFGKHAPDALVKIVID